MATWRTCHRDNLSSTGDRHGQLLARYLANPTVRGSLRRFDQKWRENSLTQRVEIQRLITPCKNVIWGDARRAPYVVGTRARVDGLPNFLTHSASRAAGAELH